MPSKAIACFAAVGITFFLYRERDSSVTGEPLMDRSANMRAIRSKGMLPELKVRSLVHSLGYRFRLHRKDLPGKPDLVFGPRRKVIFVHGCFWHSHNCKTAHVPKSNREYWVPKLGRNKTRDGKNIEMLKISGWRSLVIWECETRDEGQLKKRVKTFLGKAKHGSLSSN